jgi:serine/threonine protein kinase/Flp pilus assembly protein TadD
MTEPTHEHAEPEQRPQRFPAIEGYDIIDEIGAGGMGMVYEAIARSTGRHVAVKLMLESAMASPSASQRFEREVEFIARLDHPNIVAVLDSGTHQGRHYCVMDFVEGQLLDDALTPGVCDPREALTIIERIARAVEYAHQRGVLHRDLKPTNIMIDDRGEPHLLDFGLAKAIDPVSAMGGRRTISEPGQLIGTVAYMAPEQARGEIGALSVRTDVYALGAIAYELLTGRLPVDVTGSLGETLNRLESRDPDRPSALRQALGADIDAILGRALEKSPDSRYETAGALADDIRRLLDGFPVRARRIGPAARFGRWVRRNPRISAVVGVALVVLLVGGVVSFHRITDQRDQAIGANNELTKLFGSLGPNSAGREVTARELLKARAEDLDRNPIADPRIECKVQEQLGHWFREVRLYEESEMHLRRALELCERTRAGGRKGLATCLHELAATLWWLGEYDEAAPLYERALRLRRAALGVMHADTAETMSHLASTYDRLGRDEGAEPLHRRALEIRTRLFGPDHELTTASRMSLGLSLYRRGQYGEAETLFRSCIEQARRQRGDEYEGVAIGLTNLGRCLIALGRFEEAHDALDESLALKASIWGTDSDTYAWSQCLLAQALLELGDRERARRLAEQAVAELSRSLGDQHQKTREARELLAQIRGSDPR